jgi:hypothetical protein
MYDSLWGHYRARKASTGAACRRVYSIEGNLFVAFIDLTHEKSFGWWKLV